MALAYRTARAGRAGGALRLLLAAVVVQAGYLAMELHLFVRDVRAHPPQQHAYTSITHLMVGADHFHVFLGLLLNVFLLAKFADGRTTAYRISGLRAATLYWHFVNLLTLLVV